MSLVSPWFLAGLLFTAIPVVLHLLLRAKPKTLVFPALRLIQQRRRQNSQRLRLRHLLLLLLRILALALLVFVLARPKLPPGDFRPSTYELAALGGLFLLAASAYFGGRWLVSKQGVPQHHRAHRVSLLRYAVIAALILLLIPAVGWPYFRRIAASRDKPTAVSDDAPVSAVLLFDTSLSMGYREAQSSRLDVAREIAAEHLGRMPGKSRVAIVDTAGGTPGRLQSLSAAQSRLKSLELHARTRSLNDELDAAIRLQQEDYRRSTTRPGAVGTDDDEFVREIYLFTDLAASAWTPGENARLEEALKQVPGLHVYIVDVGIVGSKNVALTSLSLSEQSPSLGGMLGLQVQLESNGIEPGPRTVQLLFENDQGQLVKVGETSAKADPQNPVAVPFTLGSLTGTVRQGLVRLSTSDPLTFDDALSFTVQVRAPLRVLVVSERRDSAGFVTDALAPESLVKTGRSRALCTLQTPDQLPQLAPRQFDVVVLVNVSDPKPAGWQALAEFARAGGGVAVFVGSRVKTNAYDEILVPQLKDFLPAAIFGERRFIPPQMLNLEDLSDPSLRRFADLGTGNLTGIEILKYRHVRPHPEARVIATYTNSLKTPAFLSRQVGLGTVYLATTAVDRNGWSDLPTAGWAYVAYLEQLVQSLSGVQQWQFNFQAGSDVLVQLDPEQKLDRYLLRTPGKEQLRGTVPKGTERTLVLRDLEQLGSYRLLPAETQIRFERGFSIQPVPAESRLARLSPDDLAQWLPKDRMTLTRSLEGLKRQIAEQRTGKEIYPVVLFLLTAVFLIELAVAGRFYDSDARPSPVAS